MNRATFRTLCEVMGFSTEMATQLFAINQRTIRRWFDPRDDGPIPDEIAQHLLEKWNEWTEALSIIMDELETVAEENGDPSEIRFARPSGSSPNEILRQAKVKALAVVLGTQGFPVQIDYESSLEEDF